MSKLLFIVSSQVCDIIIESTVYKTGLMKMMELKSTEVPSLNTVWGEWKMWPACELNMLQYVWESSEGWYDLIDQVWGTLGAEGRS